MKEKKNVVSFLRNDLICDPTPFLMYERRISPPRVSVPSWESCGVAKATSKHWDE